jgi:hypothetical protein
MPESIERLCLECGKEVKGRRDKKFCDDQCRNTFNNKIGAETNPEIRHINGILKRNRKILEELLPPEGKIKISAKRLRDLGFDFTFITHLYTTKTGSVYRYCYEFGYLLLEGDFYLVVRREK